MKRPEPIKDNIAGITYIRLLCDKDSEAVRVLLNENLAFDHLFPSLLAEKLDENRDPELSLIAEIGGTLVGMVSGVIGERKRGFIKMMAVHRDHQRQGIGSTLLHQVERVFNARGVEEIRLGESAPNYLWPGVDVRYRAASAFFEKQGYRRFGGTSNLEVDLKTREFTLPTPNGYTIHRALPEDKNPLMAFLSEHFPSWRGEAAVCFINDPISLFLARRGGALAAFAAHEANNRGTGCFGPMGTAPPFRGRGLGRVLLARCLNDMKNRGFDRATIPWVGPVAFYVRNAGARVARYFVRFQKKL